MNANDVVTIISTLGFPIAMCCALFWYMIKTNKDHKEEVDKLRTALENNTIALTKLCDRMGDE